MGGINVKGEPHLGNNTCDCPMASKRKLILSNMANIPVELLYVMFSYINWLIYWKFL